MEYRTFVISTSARPEDVIVIKTTNDIVVLDDLAGTGIVSIPRDKENPIDGGII